MITPRDYLAKASLLLLGGTITYLFSLLAPRSKLVIWSPHSFRFDRVDNLGVIHTQTYTIQNLGRKTAEDIEIVHKTRPDYFKLQPERAYSEDFQSSGDHIIVIHSLGPKEVFSLEILTYRQLPEMVSIRSKDGPAQPIGYVLLRPQPKWKIRLSIALIGIGILTLGYAALAALEYAYRLI